MSESRESPVDLPASREDCRAEQEMKLDKDALEDAEFHEHLLSNNQPYQESLLRLAAKAFNWTDMLGKTRGKLNFGNKCGF